MERVDGKGLVYEFGSFILDPEGKTLYAAGRPVHLPAKEFETLRLLVENNGRALSKDELMSAIWGETYVEEVNLAKQVSKLRKILKSEGTDYIETIPKHGYRFSADLRLARPAAADPAVIERQIVRRLTISREIETGDENYLPEDESVRLLPAKKRSSRRFLLAGAAALIVALGFYFWLTGGTEGVNDPAAIRSVAVLPFSSVGSADGDDLLRLGLTDALITKLGSLERIVVRPTNAVRAFDGQESVAAGRSLRVDGVLNGNIQRAEDQVRVTVQLVDVRDGHLVWGGTFNEKFTDIFRVQDAIAAQVARSFELTLTGEELEKINKHYTTNPDAHYAYVKGRLYWNKRTAENFLEAIGHFNEAIRLDPNYALAYAGLADSYSLLADYRGAPSHEAYEKANAAALKALELDENLAEAHTSLAYVKMYSSWDWKGSESAYQRAIKLNPNYATSHQWYSEYLAGMGRFDEALSEIRRAKEIDPLSPVINAGEVWILYYARRYDEAIGHGRRLAEMNPQFAEVHEYLKRSYDQKGMYREAIESRQTRRKLAGLDPAMTPPIKRAAAAQNTTDYWKGRLEQELADSQSEPPSTFDLAEIYAQLGEKDKAFEWLEKAFAERTYTMMYLNVAPNLDPLRSDPRFADMLRRVGLAA